MSKLSATINRKTWTQYTDWLEGVVVELLTSSSIEARGSSTLVKRQRVTLALRLDERPHADQRRTVSIDNQRPGFINDQHVTAASWQMTLATAWRTLVHGNHRHAQPKLSLDLRLQHMQHSCNFNTHNNMHWICTAQKQQFLMPH